MLNLKNEISRTPPNEAADRPYAEGMPIMYAFDCALCEQDTDTGFVYTAVNHTTGKSQIVARRKSPFEPKHELKMAELLQNSRVAGYSRYRIARPVGQSLTLSQAKDILRHIFTEILPPNGERAGQLELAEQIFDALTHGHGEKFLTEAIAPEAYIIPLVIVKLGRMNDTRNLSLYPEMQYADMPKLSVIVSTANASRQAAARDCTNRLSRELLSYGMITAPLTCVVRKSRESFVCKRNVRSQIAFVNQDTRRELERLLLPGSTIDLATVDTLSPTLRHKICVPVRCADDCKYASYCEFVRLREQVSTFFYDVQIVSHNLMTADAINRASGKKPLLPNHQAVCIEDAQSFANAALRLYSTELSDLTAVQVNGIVSALTFKRSGVSNPATIAAKKLRNVSEKLFDLLLADMSHCNSNDERQYVSVPPNNESVRLLEIMQEVAARLTTILRDELLAIKADAVLTWVRERYKTNVSSVNFNRLFPEHTEPGATREEQRNLHRLQAIRLHQELCRLPGIITHIEHEHEHRREPRFGMNPEQYALQQENSSVKDTIWRQIEKTMLSDKWRGKGGDEVLSLIWDLTQLHEKAVDAR
jgi:ATP-dependent DNA helicase DinG